MRVVDKNNIPNGTPIFMPVVKVDVYKNIQLVINGEPFNKHIKTLKFYSVKQFNKFKKANGL